MFRIMRRLMEMDGCATERISDTAADGQRSQRIQHDALDLLFADLSSAGNTVDDCCPILKCLKTFSTSEGKTDPGTRSQKFSFCFLSSS